MAIISDTRGVFYRLFTEARQLTTSNTSRFGADETVRSASIPELVRRPLRSEDLPQPDPIQPQLYTSPRERRLYIVLSVILGMNLLVIFGALTFFALAFHK